MELVKCPKCDRTLLSSAEKCLDCGWPMKSQPQAAAEQGKGWDFVSLLIARIKALWWRNKPSKEQEKR